MQPQTFLRLFDSLHRLGQNSTFALKLLAVFQSLARVKLGRGKCVAPWQAVSLPVAGGGWDPKVLGCQLSRGTSVEEDVVGGLVFLGLMVKYIIADENSAPPKPPPNPQTPPQPLLPQMDSLDACRGSSSHAPFSSP